MRRSEGDIDRVYRTLCALRHKYGWSLATLQEALRQEWEIFYGKRQVGGLSPLEAQTMVLILKRRQPKLR